MLRKKRIKKNLRKIYSKDQKARRWANNFLKSIESKKFFDRYFEGILCGGESKVEIIKDKITLMDILGKYEWEYTKLLYQRACLISKSEENEAKLN